MKRTIRKCRSIHHLALQAACVAFALQLLIGAAVQAATLTWNGGATGDWDTFTENWWDDDAGTPTTWTNDADVAEFAGDYTVTLTEAITADGIIIVNGSDEVTIQGEHTLTLSGDAGTDLAATVGTGQGQTIHIASDVIVQGAQNWGMSARSSLVDIGGDISGTSSITVDNGGQTLRLSGDNSGWSGNLSTPDGVTVELGSDTALGTANHNFGQFSDIELKALDAPRTLANGLATGSAGAARTWTFSGSQSLEVTGNIYFGHRDNMNLSVTNTADTTLSGDITADGGLIAVVKQGGGRLILGGDNTYSQPTTVQDGALIINGTTSGQANFTVDSAATLGGTGTIGLAADQAVTVNGTLAPGEAIGALTVGTDGNANSVIFGDGATFAVEINDSGQSDTLAILGDLDLSSTSDTLAITGAADGVTGYALATYTGELTGLFDSVTGMPDGYTMDYSDGAVTLAVIPEPATAALLLLSSAALMRRRRCTPISSNGATL